MVASSKAADDLQTPIQYIKGVGPRRAARFAARDVNTVSDALFMLPRAYEDRRQVRTIITLVPGERATFTAEVLDFGIRRIGKKRRMFELILGDETGQITCRWFNFNPATFSKRFSRGQEVKVAGRVELYRNVRGLVHPDIEKIGMRSDDDGDDFANIIPIYPEIEGVYPKIVRQVMRRVVSRFAPKLTECLPEEIRRRHELPPLVSALQAVHFPAADADVDQLNQGRSAAHKRVVFEEFLLLQLGLALRRGQWKSEPGRALSPQGDLVAFAARLFGFELTNGQKKVLTEIVSDMASEKPMNRLLQGDVGSGKTALGILAAYVAAESNTQTAFMAPTEILAEQHYRQIKKLLLSDQDKRASLKAGFLTSSIKGADRRGELERIATGRVQLVVGTHALIEEKVKFNQLGLCVIDEQHRFGVLQRAKLRAKGLTPDVLVMTATPIPRTLSMTIYGDLDVSILDELPPGRSPVKTYVLSGSQVSQAYRFVRQAVARGGQAYLVYPLVEESEKIALRDATQMFKSLSEGALAGLRLGLLHGRLSAAEKDEVMSRFVAGQLDVLVATTVIEVGVDVSNATVMVVEHSERFGLSQLHQLRGRVGRSSKPGTCFLVAYSLASEDARTRMKVMERTTDGFVIAEEDLAIRGPGEFIGTRQSGLPAFIFGNLSRDADLLTVARKEAFALVDKDPDLSRPEHRLLKEALMLRWGNRLALAQVG
ncbi:MAG: ATP-dependent DNA helicase RecG [Deltaproteobacteria bacterium]|nr:ATP-dependent DNA helicase RecG [Deltaproteobacteria bacterium]MBW1872035.1 ATP-dependent DNA helicase RecG [Deltaproteobacteria bacterium]